MKKKLFRGNLFKHIFGSNVQSLDITSLKPSGKGENLMAAAWPQLSLRKLPGFPGSRRSLALEKPARCGEKSATLLAGMCICYIYIVMLYHIYMTYIQCIYI